MPHIFVLGDQQSISGDQLVAHGGVPSEQVLPVLYLLALFIINIRNLGRPVRSYDKASHSMAKSHFTARA